MHDLIVSLRSLSQGTGFFDWSYDHLQEVPDRLARGSSRSTARRRTDGAGRRAACRERDARRLRNSDELRRHAWRTAQLQSWPTSSPGRSSLKRPSGRSTVSGRCVKSLGTVWMIGPSQSSM